VGDGDSCETGCKTNNSSACLSACGDCTVAVLPGLGYSSLLMSLNHFIHQWKQTVALMSPFFARAPTTTMHCVIHVDHMLIVIIIIIQHVGKRGGGRS
jgi:hypothetical protein